MQKAFKNTFKYFPFGLTRLGLKRLFHSPSGFDAQTGAVLCRLGSAVQQKMGSRWKTGAVLLALLLGCLMAGGALSGCSDDSSGGGEICGNGVVGGNEECDDGNVFPGDGCDTDCMVEEGWTCDSSDEGEPSACTAVCGDGEIVGPEICDDGNAVGGDGCAADCTIEDGWYCDGNRFSVCVTECGDGIIAGSELCDASDLAGESCESLGLEGGTLACNALCVFDVSGCSGQAQCGNGTYEYPEECDGEAFHGATCETLGFAGGDLACNPDCTYDTSGCESATDCGNGIAEAGEACDGSDLAGESCQSLGWDEGDLSCNPDCTFDTNACSGGGPQCGNGVVEVDEACDGTDLDGETCESQGFAGGTLACSGDCTFDTSGCDSGPQCGNGVQESGEDCDATDFGGETCQSQGFDGGELSCDNGCNFDLGGCVDCGELSYCDDHCVDTASHMEHCGGCNSPCNPDQVCSGGDCVDLSEDWTLVPSSTQVQGVRAHDLATTGEMPYVAMVGAGGGGGQDRITVRRHDGTSWQAITPSPSQGITTSLDDTVALSFDATQLHVLFSGGSNTNEPNVHLMARVGNNWQEVGAPGYGSACMMHMHVDFIFDHQTPHLTTYGAGGCGSGTAYAWWDGTSWQERPSTTGFHGQICLDSAGRPAIVYTDRPYVATAISAGTIMETNHAMMWWDVAANAWAPLVGNLDMDAGTGTDEHMAAIKDSAGHIYAAWAERIPSGISSTNEIYVKQYDPTTDAWSLVGPGKVSGSGDANDPSLALIGGYLWLAYWEASNLGVARVTVKRYSEAITDWQQVGTTLNESGLSSAHMPVIVGVGGVPYVAFRENTGINAQTLHVKKYVTPTTP
jgi:cysteine-rich repeat protein